GKRAVPALLRDVEEIAFGIEELAFEIHAIRIAEIQGELSARSLDYRLQFFQVVDHEAEMVDTHPAIGGRRTRAIDRVIRQNREVHYAIGQVDRMIAGLKGALHVEALLIKATRRFEILHDDRQMPKLAHHFLRRNLYRR